MDADCIVSENDEKVFAKVFVSCIIIFISRYTNDNQEVFLWINT